MAIRVVKAGSHFSLSDAALGIFSVVQQIQGDAPTVISLPLSATECWHNTSRAWVAKAHQVNSLAVWLMAAGLTTAAQGLAVNGHMVTVQHWQRRVCRCDPSRR